MPWGDFLLKARDGSQIILKSKNRVVRGFGHAGNIVASAWAWLASNQPPLEAPLATVSEETDLTSLAQRVSRLFSLPDPVSSVDLGLTPNVYSSDPAPFLDFLSTHGLSAWTLDGSSYRHPPPLQAYWLMKHAIRRGAPNMCI